MKDRLDWKVNKTNKLIFKLKKFNNKTQKFQVRIEEKK